MKTKWPYHSAVPSPALGVISTWDTTIMDSFVAWQLTALLTNINPLHHYFVLLIRREENCIWNTYRWLICCLTWKVLFGLKNHLFKLCIKAITHGWLHSPWHFDGGCTSRERMCSIIISHTSTRAANKLLIHNRNTMETSWKPALSSSN